MSAPTQKPDPNVLDFTTHVRRTLTDDDKLPFRVDGVDYVLLRPKQAVLIEIVTASEQLQIADIDALTTEDLGKIGHVVERFLVSVEQPGQTKLRRRLADPRDDLDLIEFLPMIQAITGALVDRPTSAQPGSS